MAFKLVDLVNDYIGEAFEKVNETFQYLNTRISGKANTEHVHDEYLTTIESNLLYVNEIDHTKAAHDALAINAATLDGIDSTGFAPSIHNHDTVYVNEVDHTKTSHDALGIDAATLDGLDSTVFARMGVGVLPLASATYRGQFWRVEGGAGVADALYICEKNAVDAYVWRAI